MDCICICTPTSRAAPTRSTKCCPGRSYAKCAAKLLTLDSSSSTSTPAESHPFPALLVVTQPYHVHAWHCGKQEVRLTRKSDAHGSRKVCTFRQLVLRESRRLHMQPEALLRQAAPSASPHNRCIRRGTKLALQDRGSCLGRTLHMTHAGRHLPMQLCSCLTSKVCLSFLDAIRHKCETESLEDLTGVSGHSQMRIRSQ